MLNRSINLFVALFAITVIGIESYIYWHVQLRPWQPITSIGRLVFYYSFFTVLSNFMLALSCFWLAFNPNCNRFSFKVIRLNGLIGVIITALVYNLILRAIHRPPNAILSFTNECLHVVIPALGFLTWLIWGPFRRINFKVIVSSLLSMLAYGIYIFVRGYYTNQYPYPFINVTRIGYPKALLAVSMVVVLFLGLAFFLWLIEYLRKRK
ncbi:Pr6Pr family membrane protein [uncultured Gilliamella sp.]|uniref:Pr6Pr family membrane protein n=1 Tax=uncultured Gilliamella sp. TaxID=1193505 RepID=UPI0025D027E1|nr:Pr6Pr family membrane protein [uncultured Gilliamella sp.]